MARRNLGKDLNFRCMLLDENDKKATDVIIQCTCGSKNVEISSEDGTVFFCKDCENLMSISFIYNLKCKYIKEIKTHICEGDIVENEAIKDIVVLRDDVLTTEKNENNKPIELMKGLKIIGNIRDNPKIVEEMKKKQE